MSYLLSSTMNDGIQSHKLPGLHRQRACPKAVRFMTPWYPTGSLSPQRKNLTISFCVMFFTYLDLHSWSTFISIRLCTCGFWGIIGVWVTLEFSLAWYSALFLELAIRFCFAMIASNVLQLWNTGSKKKQPKHAVILIFTSDKTVYAIQNPGAVNFTWKGSLSCKLTFTMIITYIMLISYVKPPWCPYKSPWKSYFGNIGMGQHRSPIISLCFILQYIHDSLFFQWQIHHMPGWPMLVSDIPWLPWLQSERVMHICATLPLM